MGRGGRGGARALLRLVLGAAALGAGAGGGVRGQEQAWLGDPDGSLPGAYPHAGGAGGFRGNASPLPAAGPGGTAMYFDGVDDYALVREFRGLPSSHMSVSAWVKVAQHKSYNRILSHEWVQWGWNFYCDGAGVMRFGIGQDNKDFAAGRIVFRDRWHYVVGTYDGAHLQVWVDGLPGTKVHLPGATLDDDGYLSIGGAEWDPFHGALDELRLWNYALSREEILGFMFARPTGNEPGLVGYYRLDEGGGHSLYDMSAFRNHALVGTGRRAPRWIASDAPVYTLCAEAGAGLTVTVPGQVDATKEPKAFFTRLPDRAELEVFSQNVTGGFSLLEAAPVEIRNKSNRVVVRPAAAAAGRCVELGYQVHDGAAASAPGRLLVEVPPEGAACSTATLKAGACLQRRTQLDYVVAERERQPRVSFVVPLYNQHDLLPATVESILNQTFVDWEIVIVDDGSTDGGKSNAAAKELAERHSGRGKRVRVIEKPNGGLADARNAGVRAAHADWVLPLDSDDILQPEFLEKAFALIDASNGTNLVIADLKGFGAWEYSWNLPEYDPYDLRYTNMFHCSALFHKSLWRQVPGGYPVSTLFGYEDWAFWLFAEELVKIRPLHVREPLFLYRIRKDSMHQSLLKLQDYSLASLRMLHPNLYPAELLMGAHDKFLDAQVPEKVVRTVDEKLAKFPWHSSPHLMRGLIREGRGQGANLLGTTWEDALEDYKMAADAAMVHDWQPRWRLGLLQNRMGLVLEGNATMSRLFREFPALRKTYATMRHRTAR